MHRSTIILIVVLLVLGGITYFLIPSDKERESSYKPSQISFSIDSASVVKIELQRPSKSITIENVGGRWTITSPLHYQADPSLVLQLISGVVRFKPGSIISSNPEKQSIFQVDSSGTRLTMTDRSGKSVTLILGKIGPSYSEVYFRLPESKDVYLGEGIESWTITREVNDWRDKTILALSSESIRELTYDAGSKEYLLERDSSGWKMNGQTVESNTVTSSVNSIASLRADDFVDTMAAIPSRPITVKVKSAETVTLNLAPVLPDSSKYYVQSSSSRQVFLISKWTAQQLVKPIEKQIMPAKSIARAVVPKKIEQKQLAGSQEKGKPVQSPTSVVNVPKKISRQKGKTSPTEQPAVTPTEQNENAPAAVTPAPAQATTSGADDEGDLTVYIVKKGETMQTIAKKYNVNVEQILKWNLLKSINVKPGQELYIYVKQK